MPKPIVGLSKMCRLPGLLALVTAFCIPVAGSAGGVISEHRLTSPRLGRELPYNLYTPETPGRHPVLYLLHGLRGSEQDWPGEGGITDLVDRAIAAAEIPPLYVVMPGVGNSWYVDSAAFGPIATVLSEELIPTIDRDLPTEACRAGRAIAGLSMGGLGAVLQGLEHPERFRAVISLSGSLFDPLPEPAAPHEIAALRMFGPVFGTPFNPAKYNSANPFKRLDAFPVEAPRPDFWLAAGDDDFPRILLGSARFQIEAQAKGFTSELRVIDGGHAFSTWRRALAEALPWLGLRLGPCGG